MRSFNPFGIHNFERKKKGVGDMIIKKGEKISFRYAFLFHEGDAETAGIDVFYDRWVQAMAQLKARADRNN